MVDVKIVPDAVADPKLGTKRSVSEVRFPYYDLEKAEGLATVIHEKAGGACTLPQLAAYLGYSQVTNGGFRSRVSSARMFGLVEGDANSLRVTGRGMAIIAPIADDDARRARVDAFLEVELFRKVFEKFDGTTIPPEVGLKNLLKQDFKVVAERVAPTVRILYDSAERAGFFKATGNRSRLVRPSVNGPSTSQAPPATSANATAQSDDAASTRHETRHGGGGGKDNIHPALAGLLRELPPPPTALSSKRRKSLIEAFTGIIDFIYECEAPPEAAPESAVGIA